MNKWYTEDYEFTIEVVDVSPNGKAEGDRKSVV